MTRIGPVAIAVTLATQVQAQFIPPEEFDRPYDGRVFYQLARDQDHVREMCKAAFNTGRAPGCSRVIMDVCVIVKLSNADIRALGIDPEVFLRHEVGHCNGWGPDHKGAR